MQDSLYPYIREPLCIIVGLSGDGTVSPEEIEMAKDNEELLEILEKVSALHVDRSR